MPIYQAGIVVGSSPPPRAAPGNNENHRDVIAYKPFILDDADWTVLAKLCKSHRIKVLRLGCMEGGL